MASPSDQDRRPAWGAVVCPVLGGLGAGFYLAAAAHARLHDAPAMTTAAWLGPLLVLVGLALRPGPAWRSLEAWAGVVFAILALAELVRPEPLLRLVAALAAVVLALGEARAARRGLGRLALPGLPALFLVSSLLSGAALHVLVDSVRGHVPSSPLRLALLLLLVLTPLVWRVAVPAVRGPDAAGPPPPAGGRGLALGIAAGGYLAPAALAVVWATVPTAALGAVLVIAGQAAQHARLVSLLDTHPGRRTS